MAVANVGLGNQAVLTKIDKLRELNVGAVIPLPQLIVVGDQSSGKSSVLESLTGFAFPRATGLCTRYATQITCSRESLKAVSVSIIPRPGADDKLKAKLLDFKHHLTDMNNEKLAAIFDEANHVMGIRMDMTDKDAGFGAFSQDILKVEISGPDQTHLTVIDVPGIFRVPTPGLTTESDVVLVQNMVKSYMSNSRTIILAVMPCNVDVATQEILKLAEEADPIGVRTMGVLTKPDLAKEEATKGAVIDLVLGKRNPLKLGYCVVKNRSSDDTTSTASERLAAERAFFMPPPWSAVGDRCGIESLQVRLRELLMDISKREFPHVKSEIKKRLRQCRGSLETMGPSRSDPSSQRLYLGQIASRFQAITQCALSGYYMDDPIFSTMPTLKLATRVMELNEALSNLCWKRGHKQQLGPKGDDEGESPFACSLENLPLNISLTKYPELEDIILTDEYECPKPLKGPILERVKEVFKCSRGPEIGTFGGTILATVFGQQSEKWEPLALFYTSKAIALVHDYISRLLTILCPDKQVREQLWNTLLVDALRSAYRRAMAHARFLLNMERGGRPTTFNHYFNANLQKKRGERFSASLAAIAVEFNDGDSYVSIGEVERAVNNKDNAQQVCEDIIDALASYYKVSRKRFVDNICQQVVGHFLLDDDDGPLKLLSPTLVMGLDPTQLELIACEDSASKHRRQTLGREMESLEEATKIM